VDFPRLPALGASGEKAAETEYLAIPMQQGWRWRDPRQTVDWGEGWADYPGGGKSMQFEAYCVPDGAPDGLYLATRTRPAPQDGPVQAPRRRVLLRAAQLPPGHGPRPDLRDALSGGDRVFSGDWWDAARIYRQWALKQPWSAAGPVRERAAGTPQWLRAWHLGPGDVPGDDPAAMDAQVNRIVHLQQEMGAPLAFHAYLWQHAKAHDSGYPFCCRPSPPAWSSSGA